MGRPSALFYHNRLLCDTMSYQVLARKYRPQTFADVIAQEHITTTLKNAITSGRISSGYLFCGPRGTGKTSVARILARSINCVNGPTTTPCGECDSCTSIGLESSLDVREIDAASNSSVDDIRALKESVRYGASAENRKKIYIIDEVHRLSKSAFDALLKTLEEPPAHVIFIFATTEPQMVPETIHSRTQRFDFRRVSIGDLGPALGAIAKKEGFVVSDDALRLIARRGEGSVRDSVSLLDQLMSFSNGEVTAELVVSALGLVDQAFVFKFVEEMAAGECANALTMIAGLSDDGVDFKEFVQELSQHYRTLTLIKSLGESAEHSGALDLNAEEIALYTKQVAFYSIGDLMRIAEILSEALLAIKALDPRWMLEIAAIKIAHLESTERLEEILARLEQLSVGASGSSAPKTTTAQPERDFFNGAKAGSPSSAPQQSKAAQFTPPPRRTAPQSSQRASQQTAPSSSSPSQSSSFSSPAKTASQEVTDAQQTNDPKSSGFTARINLPTIEHSWPKFLETLRAKSRMVGSQLSMATVSEVNGNRIVATFPPSGRSNLGLVENPAYAKQVEQALAEFYGAPLTIDYKLGSTPSSGSAAASAGQSHGETLAPTAEDLLAEDAALRKVVERLEGEIVTVRKMKNSG
ncbi:DNA polymerase III subunit gamma/tau [Gemmatimonas aurantiaca]|nr:DNA polymerase III subunit gamma/tau [Gemmatimonas aurantiaca]